MADTKKITAKIKLELPAGKVNPALIGKDLAPTGINLNKFVTDYNDQTRKDMGKIIPADVTVFEDRSFTFVLKTPPTSSLIREKAGINKGAGLTGSELVGSISKEDVLEIAKIKMPDMNASSLETAAKMVEGSARSMGVSVK